MEISLSSAPSTSNMMAKESIQRGEMDLLVIQVDPVSSTALARLSVLVRQVQRLCFMGSHLLEWTTRSRSSGIQQQGNISSANARLRGKFQYWSISVT
jgi:hypothetical protein